MARINQQLLERIMSKLDISQSRAYALIDAKGRATHLPRHIAALALASERGIGISKYATADDYALLRSAPAPAAAALPSVVHTSETSTRRPRAKPKTKSKADSEARRGNTVFVVHGRDLAARDAIFAFLRAVGLRPLEWTQAIMATKKGSPYVGEVLDAAFNDAVAIVVLLTPDDEARLKRPFVVSRDPDYEKNLTGQARPNVLFEAGMAFGRNANSTVLVQIGDMRPFSDVGGRHVVHLSNSGASRQEFVTKLQNAGCNTDTSGSDWHTAGDFSLTTKRKK